MGEQVQVPAYGVQNSVSQACHGALLTHSHLIVRVFVVPVSFPSILSSHQFHVGAMEQHCQCALHSSRHEPELMF